MPQPSDDDILAALCRQYIDKQPVPSPATPEQILDELQAKDFELDVDQLRGRLRTLFAKYGVEEDRPDAMRMALVKRACGDVSSRRPPPPPWWARSQRLIARITPAGLGAGVAIASVLALGLVVLWPDDDPEPGPKLPPTSNHITIDPQAMDDARGDVTYCTGTDVASRQHERSVAAFNRQFRGRIRMQLRELAEDADQQYEKFARLQRAGSGECDVLYSDVIWTADFVQKGWLVNLSRYRKDIRQDDFVPSMLKAATIGGETWGIPKQAHVGLLFYRTDHVTAAPETWQALYEQAGAGARPRLRYQARAYEGLTVNFLEIALAAGAEDIVTAGRRANLDQEPAREALRFMVGGLNQAAPDAVLNQLEGANERAFQRGRAYFMRNWPPYEKVLDDDPRVVGKFATARLPSWSDGGRGAVLGGHILVISKFSNNRGAALAAVDFLSSRTIVRRDAVELSLAPALRDLWDDADVQRALPSYEELREGVFNATLRPLVANYQEVSRAIYLNVNRALRGEATPEEALEAAQDQMQEALDEPRP